MIEGLIDLGGGLSLDLKRARNVVVEASGDGGCRLSLSHGGAKLDLRVDREIGDRIREVRHAVSLFGRLEDDEMVDLEPREGACRPEGWPGCIYAAMETHGGVHAAVLVNDGVRVLGMSARHSDRVEAIAKAVAFIREVGYQVAEQPR